MYYKRGLSDITDEERLIYYSGEQISTKYRINARSCVGRWKYIYIRKGLYIYIYT